MFKQKLLGSNVYVKIDWVQCLSKNWLSTMTLFQDNCYLNIVSRQFLFKHCTKVTFA